MCPDHALLCKSAGTKLLCLYFSTPLHAKTTFLKTVLCRWQFPVQTELVLVSTCKKCGIDCFTVQLYRQQNSSAPECFLELFNLLIKMHSRNLEVSMKSEWHRLCPSEISFRFHVDCYTLKKSATDLGKNSESVHLQTKIGKKSCHFVLT